MKAIHKLTFAVLFICGLFACSKTTIKDPDKEVAKYVGSHVCMPCHEEIYNTTSGSAMYHALTVVENRAPLIPMGSDELMPPDDYSWDDLSFLIGAYEWSATFVSNEGYVVTRNNGSQFNNADNSRVPYKSEVENGTREFECGECHTTGWGKVANQSSPNALDAFPEMYFEDGVGGIFSKRSMAVLSQKQQISMAPNSKQLVSITEKHNSQS